MIKGYYCWKYLYNPLIFHFLPIKSMKKSTPFLGILIVCFFILASTPLVSQTYLERFLAFSKWNQQLPTKPEADFFAFIDSNTPLAKKIREKWLYYLAHMKDWDSYNQHYQPSQDINLQCFAHLANYYQGKTSKALSAAKLLWLSGRSLPPACHPLQDLLLQSTNFNEDLIKQRLVMALEQNNLSLARYLLKQFKPARIKDEQTLLSIHQNPTRISTLEMGGLHDKFYLYGLKRLTSINLQQAIQYWHYPKTRTMLKPSQQQAFLAHLALYKIIKNHDDASVWFAQVKPSAYNDVLLEWQIRSELKQQHWMQVERLIHSVQDKDNPCWQYWLARALAARGKPQDARAIFETLAKERHYYGFLASLRINKNPSFHNEQEVTDLFLLQPYQPIINNILTLYHTKQALQASRLINDFTLELPKKDKSAFIHWLNNNLRWPAKSLYLSNNDPQLNNQLSLRFPLAYKEIVDQYAQPYQIPEELVYAIMRQESFFRDDIISTVGAYGLMQIMPSTASMTAKIAKIIYHHKNELFNSQKNINIGIAYLNYLSKRFAQHPVLMAAAYNAGPTQVNYWLKNHPPKEMDIWIETLPWHETRNYLKNVVAYYAVYQFRMHKQLNLKRLMQPL